MTQENAKIVVEMKRVSKSFPGVKALDGIDFDLYSGEVHALLGENGAGKSTLMKILSGALRKDEGAILLKGREVQFADPYAAKKQGIAFIHQERSLIPYLTVAENILLGQEPQYGLLGLVNRKKLYADAEAKLNTLTHDIPLDLPVRELSSANKQLVEIAKAISFDADVIIMDEPTSSLTEKETEALLRIIGGLTDSGKAIIYISHRMPEIFRIANRATVLRDGRKVDTMNMKDVDEDTIVQMMVGRRLENLYVREVSSFGPDIIRVENLSRKNVFNNISFSIKSGEVVGFAGLVGSGRTEVVRAVFGADKYNHGEIYIDNNKTAIRSPVDAIRQGLALLPEDRKEQGLVMGMTVQENMTLAYLWKLCKAGFIKRARQRSLCMEYIEKLNIKTTGVNQKVRDLSGGNQQKVIIGKWLAQQPKVLILDEPTRGIDVGAKAEIYELVNEISKLGVAILVISSEMPELLGICDRILVLRQGSIAGEFLRKDASEEKIMNCYIGRN